MIIENDLKSDFFKDTSDASNTSRPGSAAHLERCGDDRIDDLIPEDLRGKDGWERTQGLRSYSFRFEKRDVNLKNGACTLAIY